MARFKVKVDDLGMLLRLVQAVGRNTKGEQHAFLDDCILRVEKERLSILCMDENQVLAIMGEGKLDKTDVIETGLIPVELEFSLDSLKRFKDSDKIVVSYSMGGTKIDYEREKPHLLVRSKTKPVDEIKTDIENFPCKFENNVWKSPTSGRQIDTYIKIDASEFKEIVQDGEQIQHRSFPFTIKNNSIEVNVEDDDTGELIARELVVKEIKNGNDLKSLYSYGFGNAFGQLSGEIEIWIANETPLIVKKQWTNFSLTYMLAPIELQEEDEDQPTSDDNDVSEELLTNAKELLKEPEPLPPPKKVVAEPPKKTTIVPKKSIPKKG